eukprot:scaffold15865_cov69-Phaeocystis_antarctica.AAC.2
MTKPPASKTTTAPNRPTVRPVTPPASLTLPMGCDACGVGVGSSSFSELVSYVYCLVACVGVVGVVGVCSTCGAWHDSLTSRSKLSPSRWNAKAATSGGASSLSLNANAKSAVSGVPLVTSSADQEFVLASLRPFTRTVNTAPATHRSNVMSTRTPCFEGSSECEGMALA